VLRGAVAGAFVGCRAAWRRDGDAALARATRWLWDRPDPSGAWPSEKYGLMRSGQSSTAFVLLCLAATDADAAKASAAIGWLLAQADEHGAIGFASVAPDYPVYATAMTASALAKLAPPGWEDAARPLVTWLAAQQRDHGGFPMGTAVPEGATEHVDLSMTRRALEAIATVEPGHAALARGRGFVEQSATADGSFVYSTVESALTKGLRTEDGSAKGYGSATTDGVLALLACGAGTDDPFVTQGLGWLHTNHRLDENPGVSGGPNAPFAKAMRGYYRAGAAAVFRRLGGPEDWQAEMVAAIRAEQAADGSFTSDEALQKEDDPLIATAFAVSALADALA
jgi:hypothetical protein